MAPEAALSRSQVIENCPVTGIRVQTDDFGVRRVAAVETEHGSIQTPCVVNCAGEQGFPLALSDRAGGSLGPAFLSWAGGEGAWVRGGGIAAGTDVPPRAPHARLARPR